MRILSQFLLPLSIIIFSCGTAEKTYTVEEIDGVSYIHNLAPAWGNEPRVKLEFVQKIGTLETDDRNYQFYRPAGAAVDRDKNIYIVDSGNDRVQKYSPDGKYLATIGSKGQGPGEFDFPMAISIGTDNNLYVGTPWAVSVLTLDGVERKRVAITLMSQTFALTSNNRIVTSYSKRSESGRFETDAKIQVVDQEGNMLNKMGDLKQYDDQTKTMLGNLALYETDKNDHIFAVMAMQNRLEKYTLDGTLLFAADRPLDYELKVEEVTVTRGEHTYVQPRFTMVANGIGIDGMNRIWIQKWKSQEVDEAEEKDYLELEVFDDSGILLCNLPMPENGEISVHGDKIFFIDRWNDMCVHEYRIIELNN